MVQARNEMFSFQLQKEVCTDPFRVRLFSVIIKCASAREGNRKTSTTDSLTLGKNSPGLMSLQRDSCESYMIKNALHRQQRGAWQTMQLTDLLLQVATAAEKSPILLPHESTEFCRSVIEWKENIFLRQSPEVMETRVRREVVCLATRGLPHIKNGCPARA